MVEGIEKGKEYVMQNVLSLRKKRTVAEFQAEASRLSQFIEQNKLKKSGATVSTTWNADIVNGVQVLDTELLIPLDKEFSPPEGCVKKELFVLTNAVMIRHVGNPALLQEKINLLTTYISENKMVAITPAYIVTVNEMTRQKDSDNSVIDVYVGISPNKL